jgi:hypothetical protein
VVWTSTTAMGGQESCALRFTAARMGRHDYYSPLSRGRGRCAHLPRPCPTRRDGDFLPLMEARNVNKTMPGTTGTG